VPDVDQQRRDARAGLNVNELDVEVHRHTRLTVGDVGADELAINVVGSEHCLGDEDTGCIRGKDCRGRRIDGVSCGTQIVRDS